MNAHNDSPGDMTPFRMAHSRFRLDEVTAERLIGRAVSPDDAPPTFASVARLLHSASGPGRTWEIEPEPATWRLLRACIHCCNDPRQTTAESETVGGG